MYNRPSALLRDLARHAAGRMPPAQNAPDIESLAAWLRSLGHEVEVQRLADGERLCLIAPTAGDGGHILEARLRADTGGVALAARVGTAELHQAPAPLMARLLAENLRIGPHFFGYRAGDRQLLLHLGTGHRETTPARLEDGLDRLNRLIRDTRPAWSALVAAGPDRPADAFLP